MTISTKKLESGEWVAMTECSPWMRVEADSEAIAVSIIERGLVWHREKAEERTRKAEEPLEASMHTLPVVDKLLSVTEDEVMNFTEPGHYMNGGETV